MNDMWNERYSAEEYAYGIEPNVFLKDAIQKYNLKGKMLFPAEGEGRNAVYAAKNGLEVSAFDLSIEGKNKALKLATKENVEINYQVGDFFDLDIIHEKFDAAALIYAHLPPNLLSSYHKKIAELLVPGGLILLEGFSKNNLSYREENPNIGGPLNVEMLNRFNSERLSRFRNNSTRRS